MGALQHLQSVWDNLSLLGQLAGTGIEISNTRRAFSDLATDLLNQLGTEALKKCLQDASSKAQVAINILVRNLFERTADIGFLASDGEIRAFLRNRKQAGEGDEDAHESAITAPPEARAGVVAVVANGWSSLALKSDGSVIGWGDNEWNQISIPQEAKSGVIAIDTALTHSVALKSNGATPSVTSASGRSPRTKSTSTKSSGRWSESGTRAGSYLARSDAVSAWSAYQIGQPSSRGTIALSSGPISRPRAEAGSTGPRIMAWRSIGEV